MRPHQDIVLHASNVKELKTLEANELRVKVGAMVTMGELQSFVKAQMVSLKGK